MSYPRYDINLPASLRFDEILSPSAKLLYGEVKALCDQQGYCWATNQYFAKLYKVNRETISLWLRQLKEQNYIQIHLDQDAGNQRKIYLIENSVGYQTKSNKVPKNIITGEWDNHHSYCENKEPEQSPYLIDKIIDNNDREKKGYEKNHNRLRFQKRKKNAGKKRSAHDDDFSSIQPEFVTPSLGAITEFMQQENSFDSELSVQKQASKFYNYYQSIGWRVGKNRMQDWRAAARNWMLQQKDYQQLNSKIYEPRLHSRPAEGLKNYNIPL